MYKMILFQSDDRANAQRLLYRDFSIHYNMHVMIWIVYKLLWGGILSQLEGLRPVAAAAHCYDAAVTEPHSTTLTELI